MFIPFKSELSEALQSTRSLVVKAAICAGVTTFVMLTMIVQFAWERGLQDSPWAGMAVALLLALLAGGALGLLLELKDVVEKRCAANQRVNLALRACFGCGNWSLALWFVTVLAFSFVVVVPMAILMS